MQNSVGLTIEKNPNLFSIFEKAARRNPENIAFKADGGKGKHYTYGELSEQVKKLANGLCRESFSNYMEIGILSENRPEWGIAYLAIVAAGKTVVPIDANLKVKEIAYIINHANLKAIFASDRFETLLLNNNNLRLFSFESNSSNYWLNIINSDKHTTQRLINNVAVLIYTSGTTGDPKAVELTHENLLSNLDGINTAFQFNQNDIFLSVLPLHHTFEATCGFLTPLMAGSTIVYARSLKSKEILEDIAYNKITLMCGVPLLYEKMYHSIKRGINNAPPLKKFLFHLMYLIASIGWILGYQWGKPLFRHLRIKAGLGSIREFVSGGAALPSSISRFFNLIGFDMLQGYGMTECSPVISANRPDDIKFGSVGPPLKDVKIKINNPDQNGIGEIIVKGENVTPGYRNNPEKTAELIKDGWLYTGDLGRLKDGHLWITGRQKNLIVSAAGKNIYPEQIEEKLLESSYVMEAVVFGSKKKTKQGEEVCAVIVPDMEQLKCDFDIPLNKPDMAEINKIIKGEVTRINNQMADYKRITSFEIQLNELEKTSTKKVKRFLYK